MLLLEKAVGAGGLDSLALGVSDVGEGWLGFDLDLFELDFGDLFAEVD